MLSCGPAGGKIGALISKSLSKTSGTSVSKPITRKLSKTQDFHSTYNDIANINIKNSDLNFMNDIDQRIMKMDQESVSSFKNIWKELEEISPDYVEKLYRDLNNSILGSFKKPSEMLEQLSKVELLLLASIMGISSFSDDAEAMKGINVNSQKMRGKGSSRRLAELRCRQAFDIISLRADIDYEIFLDAIDNDTLNVNGYGCPKKLPALLDLKNYFITQTETAIE